MLHLRIPPIPETQIPRYRFKSNRNLNLNLHHEIPRHRVCQFGGFQGCCIFSGNCHSSELTFEILCSGSLTSDKRNIVESQRYCYSNYGVATISRLLKMIGLFCKRAVWKTRYSATETYHFKEPTHRSHPTNRSHPIPSHPIHSQFSSELTFEKYSQPCFDERLVQGGEDA